MLLATLALLCTVPDPVEHRDSGVPAIRVVSVNGTHVDDDDAAPPLLHVGDRIVLVVTAAGARIVDATWTVRRSGGAPPSSAGIAVDRARFVFHESGTARIRADVTFDDGTHASVTEDLVIVDALRASGLPPPDASAPGSSSSSSPPIWQAAVAGAAGGFVGAAAGAGVLAAVRTTTVGGKYGPGALAIGAVVASGLAAAFAGTSVLAFAIPASSDDWVAMLACALGGMIVVPVMAVFVVVGALLLVPIGLAAGCAGPLASACAPACGGATPSSSSSSERQPLRDELAARVAPALAGGGAAVGAALLGVLFYAHPTPSSEQRLNDAAWGAAVGAVVGGVVGGGAGGALMALGRERGTQP